MSKQYKKFRQKHLRAIREAALVPLPEKPNVVEIVDALVDGDHKAIATDFLFGTDTTTIVCCREHQLVLRELHRGKHPQVLKAIARHHSWREKPPRFSHPYYESIQVHTGEWLVLKGPASDMCRLWVPQTMFTPWGKKLGPEIPHARDYKCLKCDFSFFGHTSYEHVVGYDRSYEGNVMIYECPRCFELCWYHATAHLLLSAAEHCPKWPPEERLTLVSHHSS